MKIDYTALDAAILEALVGRSLTFLTISFAVKGLADTLASLDLRGIKDGWRVVDRRLQALRKAGKIAVDRKTGWRLVAQEKQHG